MTKFEEEAIKEAKKSKVIAKSYEDRFTASDIGLNIKLGRATHNFPWLEFAKNWHSDEKFQELFDKYSNLNDNYEKEVIRSSKLESQIIDLKSQLQQQSLPVVPECVGDFLSGKSIFKIANGDIPDDVISWVQEQTYYVDLEKIISHLIILKVTGFTVAIEKPQLFYIEFPKVSKRDSYPWVVEIENGIIIDFTDKKSTALKLTEQEIKSIDERYWQFAVPVEDGE